VRERCAEVLAAGERGALEHFAIRPERLEDTARYVIAVIRERYPGLEIPLHSRWRHFAAGGLDRWAALASTLTGVPREERARIGTELALVSVLLDAGAGPKWRFLDPASGRSLARSEGLAAASFELYRSGTLSDRRGGPLRVDASRLDNLEHATLARAFQATGENPLAGLEGRLLLLRNLGRVLAERGDAFGPEGRAGALFDRLAGEARAGEIDAGRVLEIVLDALAPIWPDGFVAEGGFALGDVWPHPAVRRDDASDRLVPFHKLSQWLAYSLVEPLEAGGLTVCRLDALTGLAEYRNGGLFLDLGVIALRDPKAAAARHDPRAELVVEWRALTVALLDRLADIVRAELDLDAETLPLARVLEGGTWHAGRCIARERRADGRPPLAVASEGTLF